MSKRGSVSPGSYCLLKRRGSFFEDEELSLGVCAREFIGDGVLKSESLLLNDPRPFLENFLKPVSLEVYKQAPAAKKRGAQ